MKRHLFARNEMVDIDIYNELIDAEQIYHRVMQIIKSMKFHTVARFFRELPIYAPWNTNHLWRKGKWKGAFALKPL